MAASRAVVGCVSTLIILRVCARTRGDRSAPIIGIGGWCLMSLDNGVDVAHQEHYEGLEVQPIEVMLAMFTRDEMLGFLKGNIIKYRLRMGRKPGSDDAAKLRQYRLWLEEYASTGWISQFRQI